MRFEFQIAKLNLSDKTVTLLLLRGFNQKTGYKCVIYKNQALTAVNMHFQHVSHGDIWGFEFVNSL